jgi:hypothetical protein
LAQNNRPLLKFQPFWPEKREAYFFKVNLLKLKNSLNKKLFLSQWPNLFSLFSRSIGLGRLGPYFVKG